MASVASKSGQLDLLFEKEFYIKKVVSNKSKHQMVDKLNHLSKIITIIVFKY